MRRVLVLVLCLVAIAVTAQAQIPNPKGISGAFTTGTSGDNAHIISVRQLTNSNSEKRVKFISNFTVSDSCRIVILRDDLDNKLKTPLLSDIDQEAGRTSDDFATKYVPLAAASPQNFACDAAYVIIYAYGTGRTINYSGIVEYHE